MYLLPIDKNIIDKEQEIINAPNIEQFCEDKDLHIELQPYGVYCGISAVRFDCKYLGHPDPQCGFMKCNNGKYRPKD